MLLSPIHGFWGLETGLCILGVTLKESFLQPKQPPPGVLLIHSPSHGLAVVPTGPGSSLPEARAL